MVLSMYIDLVCTPFCFNITSTWNPSESLHHKNCGETFESEIYQKLTQPDWSHAMYIYRLNELSLIYVNFPFIYLTFLYVIPIHATFSRILTNRALKLL